MKNSRHLASMLCLMLFAVFNLSAQEKHSVRIRTYDEQLKPMANISVSINGGALIPVNNNGIAFTELAETDLPPKLVRIGNEELEAASWNYTRGTIEVIIRRKSYRISQWIVRDNNTNTPVAGNAVTFNGKKPVTVSTDAEGKFQLTLPLDEQPSGPEQFSIAGHRVTNVVLAQPLNTIAVEPLVTQNIAAGKPSDDAPVVSYFDDFDLSRLDSIQSLTVFYAIFKNYEIKNLSPETRRRIDAKFYELVSQLQDSSFRWQNAFIGQISDSSFVRDDIRNLLNQATEENRILERQREEFDEKIALIRDKLATNVTELDPETRQRVLSDIILLERLLIANESRFYKNQADYRQIINSLKETFFDVEDLESRLTESEKKRAEEQRVFRQRLFAVLSVVLVFGVLIVMLIYLARKLRIQKKQLINVNNEIKDINENLEYLVHQRTRLLYEANRELDTFLYRASHDLRGPVCSIIGLCNIARHLSSPESRDIIDRMTVTTTGMDRLLRKLGIISEINQPSNYSSIVLAETIERIRVNFYQLIREHGVDFQVSCPPDLVLFSYPNLIEAILSNLIENALYYSIVRTSARPCVQVSARADGDELVVAVHDNGIGIEDNISGRLYDMFFKGTEHSRGNGLGLYIVQKCLDTLHGDISMESVPNRFTQFTIRIPLNYQVPASSMVAAPAEEGMQVLLQ